MASVWIEGRARGYVVRWRMPGAQADADGHRAKPTSQAYENKADAVAAAKALRAKLGPTIRQRKGGPRPPERLTILTVLERWKVAKRRPDRLGRENFLAEVDAAVRKLLPLLHWETPADATRTSVLRLKHEQEGRGLRQLSYLRSVLRWGRDELGQPFDADADRAMRSPPSSEADVELLTDAQVDEIRGMAEAHGQALLIDCLLTYGWRPITACRLLCGDVRLDERTIKIGIKRNGPWLHPLFVSHVELFRTIVAGRAPTDPLFLAPSGRPWRVTSSAVGFRDWYRDNIHPDDAQGNGYQLKRWAISRMAEGASPWRRPLSIAEIQLYTGHRVKAQVLRYMRTNLTAAREVMEDQGQDQGHKGATTVRQRPDATGTDDGKVLQFPAVTGYGRSLPGAHPI